MDDDVIFLAMDDSGDFEIGDTPEEAFDNFEARFGKFDWDNSHLSLWECVPRDYNRTVHVEIDLIS